MKSYSSRPWQEGESDLLGHYSGSKDSVADMNRPTNPWGRSLEAVRPPRRELICVRLATDSLVGNQPPGIQMPRQILSE